MKISEMYSKIKTIKLKHSVITWCLLLLCVITMLYSDYKSTKITAKNISEIQKEVVELKDSQTYILLELRESEQNVKSVKSTVVQNTKQIDDLIDKYSKKYGVDKKLVHSIALVESGKNQNARSSSGAIGVMQVMPSTAKSMGENPYTTEGNIKAGIAYLSYLKDKFNGDENKIISAYNAGPNAVQKHNGVPPYKETKNYVQKVQAVKSKL